MPWLVPPSEARLNLRSPSTTRATTSSNVNMLRTEEIKQIGEIRSGDQFPLIHRQPFLLLQLFEHERLPRSSEPGGRTHANAVVSIP